MRNCGEMAHQRSCPVTRRTRPASSVHNRLVVRFVLLLALGAGVPDAVMAASARDMYSVALVRERALRAPTRPQPPSRQELLATIRAYQTVVHRYPRSGYCDNALWQASGLALEAFSRFGEARDRRTGEQLMQLIRSEYPSSSLIARIPDRLSRFEAEAVAAEARRAPVRITRIDRRRLRGVVRVTIELAAEVPYHEERLENPDRLFFDLKGTQPVPELRDTTISFSDDIVRKIRLGRHPDNTTRVVLDFADVAAYSVFTLYNPYRLVIDCRRAESPSSVASAEPAPPGPAPRAPLPAAVRAPSTLPIPAAPAANSTGTFSLSRQLGLGVSRIVIDPGHGGHDPGARGSGLTEATLVLDVAKRLQRLLAARPAIDVVLTRDSDVFVPLEERTAIANRHGADLFVSIHANASPNRNARGIETYVLNFASNPQAEALAARENSASGRTMGTLPDLVKTIALNNKLDESRDFARMVQDTMYRKLQPVNRKLRNLGVKQAPFVVLIGAAMPSVLAEVSFLSNRAEALLLQQDDYRQRIAQAFFESILRYQRSLKQVETTAQP